MLKMLTALIGWLLMITALMKSSSRLAGPGSGKFLQSMIWLTGVIIVTFLLMQPLTGPHRITTA